jgi:hypothetical protein
MIVILGQTLKEWFIISNRKLIPHVFKVLGLISGTPSWVVY